MSEFILTLPHPSEAAMRDVTFGRIALVTLNDEISEAIGGTLETVADHISPGERKPRQVNFSLPVRGSTHDVNPYAHGDRMRRQVRALLDNHKARLSGIYLIVDFDSELNCWLLMAGGELSYGEGGVSLADYELSLDEPYRVGSRRSHRRALRAQVADRRLKTVARDFAGKVFSDDFNNQPSVVELGLGIGVTDIVGLNGVANTIGRSGGREGELIIARAFVHNEIIHFEQPEEDHHKADVVIYDRHGFLTPTETEALAQDPQANYGWEEVYGPDHPLTAGDVPVIENSFCRVRRGVLEALHFFAVDQWVAGTGWVERLRIKPALNDTPGFQTLVSAQVVEWTTERGILYAKFRESSNTDTFTEVYIILQRGWTGPRIEAYTAQRTVDDYSAFQLVPADAGHHTFTGGAGTSRDSATEAWNGHEVFYDAGTAPWGLLDAATAATPHITFTVPLRNVLAADDHTLVEDNSTFGSLRRGIRLNGKAQNQSGWWAVDLRIGSALTQAEIARQSMFDVRGIAALIAR